MLTLDDFNSAAALDRDAMKLVDDAVMARCDGDVMKYAAAYDQLFRMAKLAAPAPSAGPRPIESDEELDAEIRAVMAEENVSYFEAFVLLGKSEHRHRREAADPTKPAPVCKCCSGPKVPAEKPCACPARTSPAECSCHADCAICRSLECGGVNAQARARASSVADRVLGGAQARSGGRRSAMCPVSRPYGRGARIVALREDCEWCRSGRPHPWSGPEAA